MVWYRSVMKVKAKFNAGISDNSDRHEVEVWRLVQPFAYAKCLMIYDYGQSASCCPTSLPHSQRPLECAEKPLRAESVVGQKGWARTNKVNSILRFTTQHDFYQSWSCLGSPIQSSICPHRTPQTDYLGCASVPCESVCGRELVYVCANLCCSLCTYVQQPV